MIASKFPTTDVLQRGQVYITYTIGLVPAHFRIEDLANDGHRHEQRHHEAQERGYGALSEFGADAVDVEEEPKADESEVEADLPADDRNFT